MKSQNLDQNLLEQSLDQIMSSRFGLYSKYIIQDRALPSVRDGLKPVQRRILYAMNELNLFPHLPYKKSARIVGEVIGKYHPHGDSSIYEAMVRMAQDWKMNKVLIDMHGNKGSIDDDPAAAMRYTETRLSPIALTMLENINKNTVRFVPNFDDSEKEPVVLPALFPNLLVNGARGIAAGYATEMPPHNLSEIVDAIIFKIKSPNARLDSLTNIVKGPDFPTGGIVQGIDGIYQAFERGYGKVVIRSRYEIKNTKTNPNIVITELPYGVVKQKLVREIDEIRFNKKIDGIKEVRDESDRNGICVVIELLPNTDPQLVANYLLQKTEMQIYYSYNNIAIKDSAPKQLGLIELIESYLEHQKEIQKKAINFDLQKDKRQLEIVNGLIKASKIVDNIIKTIRETEGSKKGVVQNLIDSYQFSQLQAEAIAEMRLYRLSRTDQSVYLEEKINLESRINRFETILNSPEEFDQYLIDLLREFKKNFGTERKTTIEDTIEKINVNIEELIIHEDIWIGLSREGYLKRLTNKSYESNELTNYVLHDNDDLIFINKVNTINKLCIFTSKGNYAIIPLHNVVENKWKDLGTHINSLVTLETNEKIIRAFPISDFSLKLYVLTITSDGKIKRSILSDFETSRVLKMSVAHKLNDGENLVDVKISNGFNQVIIITNEGKAVKYFENQIPTYGTKSQGINAMSLGDKSKIVAFVLSSHNDIIGLISNRGGLKRIRCSSVNATSKSSVGKDLYHVLKGKPHIVLDAQVVEHDTNILIRQNNQNLILKNFGDVDITTTIEGFSQTDDDIIGGMIIKNDVVNQNHYLLKNSHNATTNLTEEEIFSHAEETIKNVETISLDDILSKIK